MNFYAIKICRLSRKMRHNGKYETQHREKKSEKPRHKTHGRISAHE